MIPTPRGWSSRPIVDGVALAPPAGTPGMLVYRDRRRPLRPIGALVAAELAELAGFQPFSTSLPERLVTHEGEHAALVTITGSREGAPAQVDLGFVFGDDFYALLSGRWPGAIPNGEGTRIVRELIVADTQVLGLRRRRFGYAHPTGWNPIARTLATEWLAPGFPTEDARIVVYPANPLSLVPGITFERALDQFALEGAVTIERDAEPLTIGTLNGATVVASIRRDGALALHREIAIFRDHRFVYCAELSSRDSARWPEHQAVFARLVASFQAVPAPVGTQDAASIVDHWAG